MSNLLLNNKKGVTLILTLIIMTTLIGIASAFLYMTSVQLKGSAYDSQSSQAFWLAEGGAEYGCWAVRADRDAPYQTSDPAANGYSDAVYLEGYQYVDPGSEYGSDFDRACFHGTSFSDSTSYYADLKAKAGAEVQVYDFQQRYNLIGTRIKKLEIVMRARKELSGGNDPLIQLQYTENGGTTWTDVGSVIAIGNTTWASGVENYSSVEVTPTPSNWNDFVTSSNFRIRALRTEQGNRGCLIDWLALRVTVEVDALTEPWGSGSYETFPYTIENGTIESVAISDESAKLNLNYAGTYADPSVLQYLAEECGVSSAAAAVFAQEVIDYRNGADDRPGVASADDDGNGVVDDTGELGWSGSDDNPFDYVEELMQTSSMTTALYDTIKDYVTVYSWVNNQVIRPLGSRAPVNINTADVRVLRAIFRTTLTDVQADALADDIVTQRATAPFTHMCSTYACQDTDSKSFLYYLNTQLGVFTADTLAVAENADASEDNYTRTTSWNENDETATEFCYYTNTFLITAMGQVNVIQRTVKTTCGEAYDYTNFYPNPTSTYAFPTYIGQTAHAYWREVQ